MHLQRRTLPDCVSVPIFIVVLMTIITLTILMILIREWNKNFTEGATEDHLQHSHCATSYWTVQPSCPARQCIFLSSSLLSWVWWSSWLIAQVVYVSGQIGLNPITGQLVEGVVSQARYHHYHHSYPYRHQDPNKKFGFTLAVIISTAKQCS